MYSFAGASEHGDISNNWHEKAPVLCEGQVFSLSKNQQNSCKNLYLFLTNLVILITSPVRKNQWRPYCPALK
jgi:hypothetical protein